MTTFVAPVIDWAYLVPILVVLGAGVVGVLVEAFVPARARRTVQVVLALAATAAAFASVVWLWSDDLVHGEPGAQPGVRVLGGSMVIDPFALGLQAVILLLAFLAILVIADKTSAGQDAFAPTAAAVPGSPYEDLARRKGLEQTEVYPLVLFAVGGMMIFPATANLLVMFVALEVLSLPLYVLSALARRRRLLSQEASFKYFQLGAFASALFIFGVALLYGYAGTVDLEAIRQVLGLGTSPFGPPGAMVLTGLFLVLAGLLFKVGAVPFHAWTPDVYQGAPTPITGFMAACTKAAAFGALLRVLYAVVTALPLGAVNDVLVGIWIVAILTMVVGSVVGVVQTDVKRLLAYSSIAHAGFLLVALFGFSPLASRALLFYLLVYGLATVGAFAVVTLVREKAPAREPVGARSGDGPTGAEAPAGDGTATTSGEGAGSDGVSATAVDGGAPASTGSPREAEVVLGEATHLSQWAGLGRRSPWLAGAFTVFLLSMAGIPLTGGFVGKFAAFESALSVQSIEAVPALAWAWVLVVVGVLTSAVAVFFYVRIIVLMFFTPAPADSAVTVVRSRGFTTVAVAVCVIGVILLGVLPSPILDLALEAATFRL